MQLPRRGLLVNPDGRVVWAWEYNDDLREFDALPPLVSRFDGTDAHFVNDPAATVLDMTAVSEPGDVPQLYPLLAQTRARQDPQTQVWMLTLVDGAREVPHPIHEKFKRMQADRHPAAEAVPVPAPDPLPPQKEQVLTLEGDENNVPH